MLHKEILTAELAIINQFSDGYLIPKKTHDDGRHQEKDGDIFSCDAVCLIFNSDTPDR